MVDVNKLKGKIAEKRLNIPELSGRMGIDKATLYRKINNNGEQFSIKEADSIVKELGLTKEEAMAIFLHNMSQHINWKILLKRMKKQN